MKVSLPLGGKQSAHGISKSMRLFAWGADELVVEHQRLCEKEGISIMIKQYNDQTV